MFTDCTQYTHVQQIPTTGLSRCSDRTTSRGTSLAAVPVRCIKISTALPLFICRSGSFQTKSFAKIACLFLFPQTRYVPITVTLRSMACRVCDWWHTAIVTSYTRNRAMRSRQRLSCVFAAQCRQRPQGVPTPLTRCTTHYLKDSQLQQLLTELEKAMGPVENETERRGGEEEQELILVHPHSAVWQIQTLHAKKTSQLFCSAFNLKIITNLSSSTQGTKQYNVEKTRS
jgi:hypothetical protein